MKSKKSTKIATAAIIATLAIGTTAFAAQSFDGFKELYGKQLNLTAQDKTTINQYSSISGIKMTVAESIVSDKGAVIIVIFEKDDGKAFEKDTIIPTLEIANNKDLSYMVNQTLSEDKTKIVASFEIDSSKSLENQKLTVTADKIISKSTNETLAVGPWKVSFAATNQKFIKEQPIDLLVETDHEKMQLTKINVSSLGVAIEGKRLDNKTDMLPKYVPNIKITTTDGNTIELAFDSANETEKGFRYFFVNKSVNKEFLNPSNIKELSIDGKIITLN